MIKGTPAKFIDYTLAPDAETAERQVAEAHEIRDESVIDEIAHALE